MVHATAKKNMSMEYPSISKLVPAEGFVRPGPDHTKIRNTQTFLGHDFLFLCHRYQPNHFSLVSISKYVFYKNCLIYVIYSSDFSHHLQCQPSVEKTTCLNEQTYQLLDPAKLIQPYVMTLNLIYHFAKISYISMG